MDEESRSRRKAAVAAEEQRAKQKPPSRKRKAPVPEKLFESVEPFKDAPDRAVTLIGVRRPAKQRIFTSMVIMAAPNSNPIRIGSIAPFALKQEKSSLPLKKKVRKLPEGLFREMSDAEVVDGQYQPKKRRKFNAPPATGPGAGAPMNSITGGRQHASTSKDSNEGFHGRFYPEGLSLEGEVFVKNMGNTHEHSHLRLQNDRTAAKRKRPQ